MAFIYIDSSDELMRHHDPSWMTKDGWNAQFDFSETLLISSIPSDSISSSPEYYPALKEIAKNCRHLENYRGYGAMQDRRLGRVLLGFHAIEFSNLLNDQIHKLQANSGHSNLNITLVTGLSGGTGSGTVVCVASHILQRYPEAYVNIVATADPFFVLKYHTGRA